ncbi:MAG: arginase family protein, partial [Pseudomonadales bacterium]|nr:arginase family protein [Pseudomonadales bacterium]
MRKPHFFNLYSNLGVRKLWRGVECDMQAMRNAPQYFWDDDFKNKFPKAKIDNFICHDSAEVKDWNDYLSKYVANVQAISELIENKLQTKETSVVIGGDHSIALPNILANLQRVDSTEKFGVLIFDSHEDFMQSEISRATSTGNFHGMWLRPLFDKFDEPVLDNLVPHKLPLSNLFYVGNLDIEDEPKDFFA